MYLIRFKFINRPLLFVILILAFFGSVQAQDNKVIDSLSALIEKKTGPEKFDVFYDLTFEYIAAGNFQRALDFLNQGQTIAIDIGDSLRMVKSSRVKAQILRRLSRLNEGIFELNSVLPIAKRNNFLNEQKFILNGLAVSYTFLAQYDKALEFHFQALILKEKDGDHEEIRESLNNIGLTYFKLKNFNRALEYYYLALEHDNFFKKSNFKDQLLINIGLCHNQLKNFAEAQKLFFKALDYCHPNCNDQTQIAGEFGLGVSFYGQSINQDAKLHFKKSFELAMKTDNKRFMAENLLFLGRIYLQAQEMDSAVYVLTEAEMVAKNSDYNEVLIDVYKEIVNLYDRTEEYQQSSFYQNKYIKLKDSIYSESLIDNLAKVQTEYAERKNIATIADKEEIIQRQRSLNVAIVIIALLAALLIFVLYRSNMVKKKVNTALSDAKAIIEDQNLLLLNSNIDLDKELKVKNIDLEKANESLRRVNDELDNFIYKTSHDIRGPLASLKGMCNVALMDVKDETALGYLKKLDITAEKLNTILTRLLIVNQINNSALHSVKIDFHQIVQELLLLETKKGMPARLMVRKKIDPDIEFYSDKEFTRIILENLVDNAIKFYNDSQRVEPFVDITITMEAESVLIRVVDNGIGISQAHPDKIFQMFSRASERSETGGIGLYITKTAVEKLGGTINLRTTPEGYTEFHVNLPLTIQKVEA